jgi:hypothetical protein
MENRKDCIHPRVWWHAWGLNQDNLLKELDTAYAQAWRGAVHAAEDIGLDGEHDLPVLCVGRIGDARGTRKYKRVLQRSSRAVQAGGRMHW